MVAFCGLLNNCHALWEAGNLYPPTHIWSTLHAWTEEDSKLTVLSPSLVLIFLYYQGFENSYLSLECKQCKPGCGNCTDDKPCEITLNWPLRICLLTISILIMCFIPAISYFIWKYKDIKVLRAASPKLLWLILTGAMLLYCPVSRQCERSIGGMGTSKTILI